MIDAWTSARADRRDRRARHRAAHPGRRGRQRREPPALRPPRRRRLVRRRTPHGFTQPSVPYRLGGGATPRPVRRRAERSGATPTGTAPASTARRPRADVERRRRRRGRCPSRGSACSTSPRSGPGPLIGHACAILGAEVIHVESTKQPDGIRCNTTRPMSEPRWWEWCPMFQGSNTNKLDLAVELDTDRGRELFLDLVAVSDVVIDNFSPRVLEQLDLDQDVLLARNPQRDRAARAGLRRRRPVAGAARVRADHRGAVGDRLDHRVPRPRARTAVGHRRRARRRARDVRAAARARVPATAPGGACSSSARWSARRSTSPRSRWSSTRRTGGCSSGAATARRPCVPQGVYRTADIDPDGTQDRWVAISVADDDQWRALRRRARRW